MINKNTVLKAITTVAVIAIFSSVCMDDVKAMFITWSIASGWLLAFGKANGLF